MPPTFARSNAVLQSMVLGSLFAGCLLFSGCATIGRGLRVVMAAPFQSRSAAGFEMPVNSGPGLIVCEPVTSSTDSSLANFGAGCARWLHFTAAGQPEMGRSPSWGSLDRIRIELKKKNLQMTSADVRPLSTMAGVTHAAVGSLEGDQRNCTLRYQLWEVPSMKPVGPALSVTGSEVQVVAGLHGMAQQMVALLNVPAHELPSVNLDASDLTTIGSLPICPGPETSSTYAQQLGKMAAKSPLAGMLYLRCCLSAKALDEPIINQLLAQAPENGIALQEVALTDLFQLAQHHSLVEQNLKLYPNCYLFDKAGVSLERELKNSDLERQFAQHAVHCAPQSPDAWITLARTYTERASRVRKGRLANEITVEEWPVLRRNYYLALEAAAHSVNLDKQNGMAWERLAETACFAAEDRLADRAFRTAISLDKGDVYLYFWGLQMYQPKWFDRPEELQKVADRAVRDHYANPGETAFVAATLQEAGFSDQEKKLMARTEAESQARLHRDPADPYGLEGMAAVYLFQRKPSDATQAFGAVVRRWPHNADAHYKLGMLLENANRPDEAIIQYRASLQYRPDNPEVEWILNDCTQKLAVSRGAEQPFRNQIKQQPSSPDGHVNLSRWLVSQRRLDEGITEAREAVRLAPDGFGSLSALLSALAINHQWKEAVQIGQRAVALYPNDTGIHNDLAYAYGELGQQQSCANECLAALRINPQDALAHENLGDALIALGHKKEAQAEWRLVMQIDHDQCAQEAEQMLAKYP